MAEFRLNNMPKNPLMMTMCSSRGRINSCKEMVNSYYDTRTLKNTNLVIYVSTDDPQLDEYREYFKKETRPCYIINKHRYLVQVYNHLSCEVFPGLRHYHEANNDHIFRTKSWDFKLVNVIETKGQGWGVSCGNDLVTNDWYEWKHPSAHIISGNIVRSMRCFIWPTLEHFGSDIYVKEVAESINSLFFLPEVIIEHMHPSVGKGVMDESYFRVYDTTLREQSEKMLRLWRMGDKDTCVRRLKMEMNEDQSKKLVNNW